MSDTRVMPLPTAARPFDERAYEFCLVVITDPDPDVPPAAALLYNADGIHAAIGQGRRMLADCPAVPLTATATSTCAMAVRTTS